MNDIIQQQKGVVEDYKATAIEYLNGMSNIPQRYASQFIEICRAFSLNPFKRECYAVGYGDKWNIITGYEVYIKRAERTGKLDGWECVVENQGEQMVAKLTIFRKDWSHPFHHFVLYNEAVQRTREGKPTSMWAKMGSFMLRKVCIAQGFRLCFPDELGGMPYTSDELPEMERKEERNITPAIEVASKKVENNNNIAQKTVVQKFEKVLKNYQKQLGSNFQTAYEVFQTGSDAEVETMYNRCLSYLSKKGIKVV